MERELQGIPVVPGVGWGPVVRPGPRPAPPVGTEVSGSVEEEASRMETARSTVIARLNKRAERSSGDAAAVLTMTAAMAGDPELAKATDAQITAGHSAVQAVWLAANAYIDKFRSAGGMLAERSTDIADIRDRILAELLGLPEPGVPTPKEPSILVADDLAPADAALLDPRMIEGIAIRLGGPTSHTAIIARQLGIPCVVAVSDLDEVRTGAQALIDGLTGEVVLDPDPQKAHARCEEAKERAERASRWAGQGATSDGHPVELLANVQDGSGARQAAAGVAVGVGLYRTELTFLNSQTEPGIERQVEEYRSVLEAYDRGRVVIRTLDAGSDKPMPFLPHGNEENPALGMRGLRVALTDPGLLERQLDAIAQASTDRSPPWVMAPMVATSDEARRFAELVRDRGLVPGVMIEIPAAALRAEEILEQVDFVSIGTNDLAQYTMAADRLSPDLASLCDPWQPAVLDLISFVCRAGQDLGKPVGVCGEAAADPLLAAVLVGLGVSSLSAAHRALPMVGAMLERLDLTTCQEAARSAREALSADHARRAAQEVIGA